MSQTHAQQQAASTILRIAIPAIGDAYLQNLIGIVDMFFVAKLGLLAVDAVGVTNIYSMTYIALFTATATALSVFLARAVGEKNLASGQSVVWHGFLLNLASGLVLALVSILFHSPLLHLMGATGRLEATALPYFLITLGISPLIAVFTAQTAAFRATGDTKTPFRVGLEMNAIHFILDYLFIFGFASFHGYGLKGAAIALVCARFYGWFRLWLLAQKVSFLATKEVNWSLQMPLLASLIRFGVPAALERLFMRLGQIVYFGLIVRMGIGTYAAHNIAGTMTVFASTIGSGFATAAIVSIGQAIGRKEVETIPALRRWGYIYASTTMTIVTAILCAFSPFAGYLFTQNQHVIHLLFIVLAIDTCSQPFLAAVLIDTAAIQANGDSRYPMIVTALGIWGIRTLGVYLFGVKFGFGLPAVWASIAADNAFRTILFRWYYKKKHNSGDSRICLQG